MDSSIFNEAHLLHQLKHYLPSQNPLKDFVHHNSLHAFQEKSFHEATLHANTLFGYKGYLGLREYRTLYQNGKISAIALSNSIKKHQKNEAEWKETLLNKNIDENTTERIGAVRNQWKSKLKINLDKEVFPFLVRLLSSFFDQGVAIWQYPAHHKGFLESLQYIETRSKQSILKSKKARKLLLDKNTSITSLLKLLVGDEQYFEHYVFDMAFYHPGWSGMVAVLEESPHLLYDKRAITLEEFIKVELILELDVLYSKFHDVWSPLGYKLTNTNPNLFAKVENTELFDAYKIWQEAYEWTYYTDVLNGVKLAHQKNKPITKEVLAPSFQAFFCIDDRELSLRSHLESFDANCATYGTPGHFNIVAMYRPDKGKFTTKVCPAPLTPKHLFVEKNPNRKIKKDRFFHKKTHSAFLGWIYAQTLGFLGAFKLFKIIFKPTLSEATNYAFQHMHKDAELVFDYNPDYKKNDGLQFGFTLDEKINIVEGIIKSTGLTSNFAPLVYFVGHGASSTNNPYYAGYGCGACSGRPGSANARAAAAMANDSEVRKALKERGIDIPNATQFIGGLHDTTRDEIAFYDEKLLTSKNLSLHSNNVSTFNQALIANAKERARRFNNIKLSLSPKKTYKKVKDRSVAIFEIRPEYNHATNTLFIVGQRELTKNLFLDRRAFLNSYNYKQDSDGAQLATILGAGAGVCAGINLEYYFSRIDNERLGAGSKLPQNIVGLIGISNGVEGDLRTGLPYQMVEIHDPLRLLTIIECSPKIVEQAINSNDGVKQWYANKWMNLIVLNPDDSEFYEYDGSNFNQITIPSQTIKEVETVTPFFEQSRENLPVMYINQKA